MPFSAAFTQRAVHYTSTHACTHLRVCFPLFLIFTCTCIVGAVFVLAVICKRCARKMRYFFGWTVNRYVVSVFVRRRSYPHTISKLLTQNCVYIFFRWFRTYTVRSLRVFFVYSFRSHVSMVHDIFWVCPSVEIQTPIDSHVHKDWVFACCVVSLYIEYYWIQDTESERKVIL